MSTEWEPKRERCEQDELSLNKTNYEMVGHSESFELNKGNLSKTLKIIYGE